MGDLTRAQLRAEVIANLGDKTNLGSGKGLDTLNRALDRVQTRIARLNLNGWSELSRYDTDEVSVVPDVDVDALYTDLPAKLDKIKALFVQMESGTSTIRLIQMVRSQWDTLIGDPTVKPTGSRILQYVDERGNTVARQLRWWPVPNVDFLLHRVYTVHPTAFPDDDTVSEFEDKDDIIIAGTTHYMLNRFQAFEEAEIWRKGFMAQIKEAERADRNKPDVQAIMRDITVSGTVGSTGSSWLDPFTVERGRGGGRGRR